LIRKGLATWQATGAKVGGTRFYVVLTEVCGKTENVEEGLNVIAEAVALAQTSEECFWEAELYRVKGELLLMQTLARFFYATSLYRPSFHSHIPSHFVDIYHVVAYF